MLGCLDLPHQTPSQKLGMIGPAKKRPSGKAEAGCAGDRRLLDLEVMLGRKRQPGFTNCEPTVRFFHSFSFLPKATTRHRISSGTGID